MDARVALSTECNQVLFLVATRLAAEFEMVYLQALHTAAELTAPSVAFQHLPLQFAIALGIESDSSAFEADVCHEACRPTSDRKASCCGPGRSL